MTPNPISDLALLEWHIDLGATEAIGDVPINRYEVEAEKPVKAVEKTPQVTETRIPEFQNSAAQSMKIAAQCSDLAELKTALAAFEHCDLKKGARNLVFADGNPAAHVMVIGEAPDQDEDRAGLPFVGRTGQLLDKMFAAIDLDRKDQTAANAIYITNILPWRPPQNRDPSVEEIEMMLPFITRHIALVNPKAVVLMGNTACQALLGQRGISRLRGQWTTCQDVPTLPMFHPAHLLRNPAAKREAWADLLSLKVKLKA